MFFLLLIGILIVGIVIFETHCLKVVADDLNDSAPLGLKYIHISDLHGKTRFINGRISERINREAPDFVVVTGDLTDFDRQIKRVVMELADMTCPVIMVLGNHDRMKFLWVGRFKERRLGLLMQEVEKHNRLRLLVNEGLAFAVKETTVSIYGFDNSKYGNELFGAVDDMVGEYKIILAHSPTIAKVLAKKQIDFNHLLVGHTHGNQINLPYISEILFYQSHVGLTKIDKAKYFSISKGLGTSRIPIRINCRPEMAIYRI